MKQQNRIYKDFTKAEKQQRNRYKKRVSMMLKNDYYNTYFLTITFNDETLNQTSAKTRLRYVKDFMIKQFKTYALNIDYGKQNHREHYHAVAINKYKIICFDAWKKYGFLKAVKVSQSYKLKQSTKRTTADKLTDHAFKETTENNKVIYSRKQTNKNNDFKRLINNRLNTWLETPSAKKGAEEIKILKRLRNSEINRKTAIKLLNNLNEEA